MWVIGWQLPHIIIGRNMAHVYKCNVIYSKWTPTDLEHFTRFVTWSHCKNTAVWLEEDHNQCNAQSAYIFTHLYPSSYCSSAYLMMNKLSKTLNLTRYFFSEITCKVNNICIHMWMSICLYISKAISIKPYICTCLKLKDVSLMLHLQKWFDSSRCG